MNKNEAFNAIIAAHLSPRFAMNTICDYLDDPAAISSPSMIDALDALLGDPDDTDTTETAEMIAAINPSAAAIFCEYAELCPIHFSDPEICADDH